MNVEQPISVQVTRRFTQSAECVFDAWLNPATAATWMFATETGQLVRAEIDPRVGGTYTFVDRRDGQDVAHAGTYLEIDRPRRLVFTFGVPSASTEFDRVTIEIVPVGSGCELTLTHEMKPEWQEYVERTQTGWGKMLDALARTLSA